MNKLDLEFNAVERFKMSFAGVQSYYFVERDAAGNPTLFYSSQDYDVQNDGIANYGYFSGKTGELVVTLTNGIQVAYSTGGKNAGQRILPFQAEVGVGNVSGFGYRGCRGNSVYVQVTSKEEAKNKNPLAQFVFVSPKDQVGVFLRVARC